MKRRHLLASGLWGLGGWSAVVVSGCTSAPAPSRTASSALEPPEYALLNRVSWGASSSSAAAFAQHGRRTWLQRQLHPLGPASLPAAAQGQIDAMTIVRRPLEALAFEMEQLRRALDTIANDDDKKAAQQAYQQEMNRLAREAASRALLHALYSPNQLQEQLTWFWFNHFNVHQYKHNLRVLVGDYEERALRPRALGRFRDLLIASATHPAMVRYLDNEQNAARRINENYAREVMELHTLGVDGGYSQRDVQELARVLTGLGVNLGDKMPTLNARQQPLYLRQGLTEFNPARHDMTTKTVLGVAVAGLGWDEILEQLTRLARHPATARSVCRKLALYFVSESPPVPLVDRMAATFDASDGDIAATLQTMFDAREFAASLGGKFKDPLHYVVSAVRLAYDDKAILNTGPMLGWLNRLGQGLYNRQTPDGYPLDEAAWSSAGQMATRFEIARAIGSGNAGLFRSDGPTPTERPAFPQLSNALYHETLALTLGEHTHAALDRASSPQEWNVLLLSSPEFMWR